MTLVRSIRLGIKMFYGEQERAIENYKLNSMHLPIINFVENFVHIRMCITYLNILHYSFLVFGAYLDLP